MLPAIAEERSAASAPAKPDVPSLDVLDGLFKELMYDYASHTTRCASSLWFSHLIGCNTVAALIVVPPG
jgi:hypothetical protein